MSLQLHEAPPKNGQVCQKAVLRVLLVSANEQCGGRAAQRCATREHTFWITFKSLTLPKPTLQSDSSQLAAAQRNDDILRQSAALTRVSRRGRVLTTAS